MTWTNCIKEICKKQSEPMHQATYWSLFIVSGLIYVLKTVEAASAASYDIIVRNPDIAEASWLASGFFM